MGFWRALFLIGWVLLLADGNGPGDGPCGPKKPPASPYGPPSRKPGWWDAGNYPP
jgi:hypothetical protein